MDFDDLYTPIPNIITPNAPFNGCLFETYGEDHDYVLRAWEKNPNCVWSFVEGDNGEYVIFGYHSVNVIGYLITSEDVRPEDRMVEFSV